MFDFPTLDLPPAPAPAPAPAPKTAVVVAAAAVASLKETALASFEPIEAHLRTLAEKYRDVGFDVGTTKGMNDAKAARLDIRENGRYAVQRLQKRLKDEANDLKRIVDGKATEMIALVEPAEAAIHAQIEAEEARKQAAKEAREKAEAERRERHEGNISTIRSFLTRCQEPGMTSERIATGIGMLEAVEIGADWQEYEVAATTAKGVTLTAMRDLYAAALVAEEDARERERQRIENARVAAELAAERQRIADEAAEVKRQAAELQRKINEQAEREAAAVLAAQRAESERLEALAEERRAAQRAMQHPSGAPMFGTHVKENGDHIMLDEHGKRSIFCDVDEPTVAEVEQVLLDTPQAEPVPAAPVVATEAPLFVTLAEVCASIGDGFWMSDEFVTHVLRFEPAVRDGGELVFLPEQATALLRKLAKHVEALA